MSILNKIAKSIKEVRDTVEDLHEETKGGDVDRGWPEGPALLRLIGYIEVGDQHKKATKMQAETTVPDAFILEFAVFSPQGDEDPRYQWPDGRPKTYSTFFQKRSRNAKSNCFKWFRAMDYTGEAKFFPDLLDNTYQLTFENKDGRMTADMKTISPARDVRGREYEVPEVDENLFRLFLWDAPKKWQWTSLGFTDNDGNERQGYYQRLILQATNFEGSAIQQILENGGVLEKELEYLHATDSKRKPDSEDGSEEEEGAVGTPPKGYKKPAAKLPALTPAKKVAVPDSEEEDEEDEAPTPPAKKGAKVVTRKAPVEKQRIALPDDDEE